MIMKAKKKFLADIIDTLSWMLEALKYQFRQTKVEPDHLEDIEIAYSPELTGAMELLAFLKEIQKTESHLPKEVARAVIIYDSSGKIWFWYIMNEKGESVAASVKSYEDKDEAMKDLQKIINIEILPTETIEK